MGLELRDNNYVEKKEVWLGQSGKKQDQKDLLNLPLYRAVYFYI